MSKKQTADQWLKYAIVEIRKRIKKYKVEDTGALYREVTGSIQELSGGDAYKAEILHRYYGIFPDRGTGRGQSSDDVAIAKLVGSGRKRKPWTRAIAAQSHRFGEVMAEEMAKTQIEKIKGSLDSNIVIGF